MASAQSILPLKPIAVQRLESPLYAHYKVSVYVARADNIHPLVSGNKWYKLKYNLKQALDSGARSIATFGGAWSNHIHATAYACQQLGIPVHGLIRGLAPPQLSPTLVDAKKFGMQLHFLSKRDYAQKEQATFLADWSRQLNQPYWLPEGGANALGVSGAGDMLREIQQQLPQPCDYWACACGTGSTLAGWLNASSADMRFIGFPVIKQGLGLSHAINAWLTQPILQQRYQLDEHAHFGGYGKKSEQVATFMANFQQQHGIALDPVYTAKLFLRLEQLIENGFFQAGTRILCLHSGGLQGARSYETVNKLSG